MLQSIGIGNALSTSLSLCLAISGQKNDLDILLQLQLFSSPSSLMRVKIVIGIFSVSMIGHTRILTVGSSCSSFCATELANKVVDYNSFR